MMNRALLRAPLQCQKALRALPPVSNAASRPAFLAFTNNGRTLTSTTYLRSNYPSSTQSVSHETSTDAEQTSPQNDESAQHIPWYLQGEAATPITPEISSKEQILELPDDPPTILPVLLDYVFKDIGLDNLNLFDLRGLETPPALGANVIMIIGTARSVKHLNVSADRLCRWLRSNYKLSPYADGLLGRNELKIKLRRKARRLRIASRTGTVFDEKDDGITTGWICVNAGVVEKGPVEEQEARGFEGFGAQVGGTRVVVQIFTEEKRAEVDLDGLWQANLDRAERQKQKHSGALSNAPDEVRSSNSAHSLPSDAEFRHVPRSSASGPFEQRRQLHISRRLRNIQDADPIHGSPHSDHRSDSHRTQSLFQYLSELPDKKARSELGNGLDDRSSTLFLQLFNKSLAEASAEEIALAMMELMCVAVSRQHGGYDKKSLHRSFMGCTVAGYSIPDELGSYVVSSLLSERPADDGKSPGWLPESDRELALHVVEQLTLRGMNTMTLDMFTRFYTAATIPTSPGGAADPAAMSRIARMIDRLNPAFDPKRARDLMVLRFQTKDYDGFWNIWRKLPLNNSPRTYDDYQLLFRLHAAAGEMLRTRDCLSTWTPMMKRENPPIPLSGPLLQTIIHCILLVDPDIEVGVAEGSMSSLAHLWKDCQVARAQGSL